MSCLTYHCNIDNSLTVNYGNKKTKCVQSGELVYIEGETGYIVCPDLERFCL